MALTHNQNDTAQLLEEKVDDLLESTPEGERRGPSFWGRQFDLGLAWVSFPRGCGGLGVDASWEALVRERIECGGGSSENWPANVVGMGMAAPTLVAYGEESLRRRLLRPLFTTEEIWCQLFSEPGAGSDLAGLATSAVPSNEGWRVNGQKVWTTMAHRAKWGLLLARTDPNVPKHKGLTYFIIDMHQDGVEVRPLYEMSGEAEFNEVYLTDALVPDGNRLGPVGDGWRVAITTLMNERTNAAGEIGGGGSEAVDLLLRAWAASPVKRPADRDRVMRGWVRAEILRLTQMRAAQFANSENPGPEGSVSKLAWAEINQLLTSTALDLLGSEGALYPDGYTFHSPDRSAVRSERLHHAFLRARANSIEGGTSEIMRNVLAERVLGLPGEPRTDTKAAWRDIPRN